MYITVYVYICIEFKILLSHVHAPCLSISLWRAIGAPFKPS